MKAPISWRFTVRGRILIAMKVGVLKFFVVCALAIGGLSASPIASAAQPQSSPAASPNAGPNLAADASILMYHHIAWPPRSLAPAAAQYFVPPTTFDSQLYYLLANGYNVVPLTNVVDALRGGPPLPPRSVAITIDDGWQDFWQNGLSVVTKYLLPVTLFVIADADSHGYMTPDERWALDHSGVDIEAHTLTHPFLTRLSPARATAEIANSKKALQHELGVPVRLFAYPYGDYNASVLSMVQAAGYDAAFAAGPSPDENTANLFRLPRVAVSYYDTHETFAKKVADYRWNRTHFIALPAPPRPISPPVATPTVEATATPLPSPEGDAAVPAPTASIDDEDVGDPFASD